MIGLLGSLELRKKCLGKGLVCILSVSFDLCITVFLLGSN